MYLHVDKHLSGDPYCYLEGKTLTICEESKTIRGGKCTFYIKNISSYKGNFVYEFSLDQVYWSPKYGELMINPDNQRFVITTISGAESMYHYKSEFEVERAREEERRQLQLKEDGLLASDKKQYSKLDKLIQAKNYNQAIIEISKLNLPEKYPKYNALVDFRNEEIENERLSAEKSLGKEIDNLIKMGDFISAYEKYLGLEEKEKYQQKTLLIEKVSIAYINQIDLALKKEDLIGAIQILRNIPDENSKINNTEKIQIAIDNINSKIDIPMDSELLNSVLTSNNLKIDTLSKGAHVFKISCSGALTIDGKTTTFTIPLTKKYYDSENIFTVCHPQVSTLTVALQETVYSKKIYSGFKSSKKKSIYKTEEGKLYKGGFWSKGYFDQKVATTYKESLSKKEYQKVDVIEVKKILNGTQIISTSYYEKSGAIEQFKNRLKTKIFRVLITPVLVYYPIIRFYEIIIKP
jgi:hypothetical protein